MPSMTAQFDFSANINHTRSNSYSSYASSVSDSHSEPESTHTTSSTSSTSSTGRSASHGFKKVLHKRTNTHVHQLSISASTSIPTPPTHTHPYIQRLLDVKTRSDSTSLYYEHSNLGTITDLITESKSHYGKIEEGFIWDLFMQLSAALVWIHSGGEGGKWGVRRRWDLRVRGGGKKEGKATVTAGVGITGSTVFLHKLPSGRVISRLSRPASESQPKKADSKMDVYELAATIKSLCTLNTSASTLIPPYYSARLASLIKRCLSTNPAARLSAHDVYIETVKAILERKCLSSGRSHTDAKKVEEWMMSIVDWDSTKSSRSSKEVDSKTGKPVREKNLMEWAVEVKCDEISEMIAEVMARENEIEEERRKFTEGKTRGSCGQVEPVYGKGQGFARRVVRMM
ncbi:hypothetical protein BJ508DRAFT_374604 [Ascobolus immersus RN42]|uniref:Protein kinase domain-containing protein n=1 Tax=Ascobolus immersus RN42 TaxID=1160509 RepID=A0A3N4III7_ASCIM|nr:hypothetical protein BJ508DRAFT_374604 [Ascobolus immersus RN42]